MYDIVMSPDVTVRLIPESKKVGRVYEVELLFTTGVFAGLKLIGFSIWETSRGGRSVTFPARQYSVNGERRSFALLRPLKDAADSDRVRDLILSAAALHETHGDGMATAAGI